MINDDLYHHRKQKKKVDNSALQQSTYFKLPSNRQRHYSTRGGEPLTKTAFINFLLYFGKGTKMSRYYYYYYIYIQYIHPTGME